MFRLVWEVEALQEIEDVIRYIKLDKPSAARKYFLKVKKETSLLSSFPNLGKVVEGISTDQAFRELIISPCRIFYRHVEDTIYIVHVIRTERNFDISKLLK